MDPGSLKDWLVPVSTFITLITGTVAGLVALREYRLKVQAETRLTQSAELEADIKLLTLFVEIMTLAHGRGGNQVSEKAIERILSPEVIKELGLSGKSIRDILDNAVIKYQLVWLLKMQRFAQSGLWEIDMSFLSQLQSKP